MKKKKDMKIVLLGVIVIAAILGTAVTFYQPLKTTPQTLPAEPKFITPARTSTTEVAVGKKQIYRLNLNPDNAVLLVGEIGSNAQAVAQEILAKSRKGKPIYLLINSPGGSVLDGVAVIGAIQGAPGPVYTVCLSLCASMAAVTFSYGTERYMSNRSVLMHHQAAGGLEGSFNQIRSRFNTLEQYVAKLDYEVATRAGVDPKEFQKELSDELWMDSDTAIARHFADKVALVVIEIPESDRFNIDKVSQTKALKDKVQIDLKWHQ